MAAHADPAPELAPGQVVGGRYLLGEPLGRGGFGVVFDAVHTGTRQPVAIKVLHRNGCDSVATRRFLREARATASLDDPHIIRVLDVGVLGRGALYMAMERLRGQTLEQFLQPTSGEPGVLSEAAARELAQQVLQGLAVAHRSGLVHRDIKPANLFLTQSTQVPDSALHIKILDFGIAWLEGSNLTQSSGVVGSPNWMSPEQCEGLPIDGRSDVYSLGAVLFRCLAGRPLFGDASPMSAMYRHVHEAPQPLERVTLMPVSAEFCLIVHRALAKRPEERFADAQTMRDCLRGLPPALAHLRVQGPPTAAALTHTAPATSIGSSGSTASPSGLASATPAWLRNTARQVGTAPQLSMGSSPTARAMDSEVAARAGNRAAAFALTLAVLAALVWFMLERSAAQPSDVGPATGQNTESP